MHACESLCSFLNRNGEAVTAPIMPNEKPRSGGGREAVFGIEGQDRES